MIKMNTIDILAVLFSAALGIKCIIYLVSPRKTLVNGIAFLSKNIALIQRLYLALTIMFGAVLVINLSVVEIVAVMMFAACFFKYIFCSYREEAVTYAKQISHVPSKALRAWPALVIAIALSVWAMWVVFI